MTQRVGSLLRGTRLIVAGSTLAGEEEMLLAAWPSLQKEVSDAVMLIAPRHPDRFDEVEGLIRKTGYPFFRCSQLMVATEPIFGGTILLLDTIGDLASMYGIAAVAFVGGSLVVKGGHNPLEPAQFGVPVVMGPSFENFRDIVGKLIDADGVRIVKDEVELEIAFRELLTNPESAQAMGKRGLRVFEQEQGATARAVEAVVEMVRAGAVV